MDNNTDRNAPQVAEALPRQIHVLLIDDDEALLRLFGGYLKTAGFDVIYAHDGDSGREMARRFQPDLVLLDLTLPGMDGYEVGSRLKSEEATKHIPVVILTSADASPEAQQLFKDSGMEAYLHKSIEAKDLIARIKEILKI